jgi:hypothetical protein
MFCFPKSNEFSLNISFIQRQKIEEQLPKKLESAIEIANVTLKNIELLKSEAEKILAFSLEQEKKSLQLGEKLKNHIVQIEFLNDVEKYIKLVMIVEEHISLAKHAVTKLTELTTKKYDDRRVGATKHTNNDNKNFEQVLQNICTPLLKLVEIQRFLQKFRYVQKISHIILRIFFFISSLLLRFFSFNNLSSPQIANSL